MRRIDVDRIFEICLLLVTVIAASELSYASYFFALPPENSTALTATQISQQINSNTIVVNSIFRWTTLTIFILVITWIAILIVPKLSFTSPILTKCLKRRFAKEFCWCLFGSLFIFEFINFFAISYKFVPHPIAYFALPLALPLTFFATWQYRKDDIYEMKRPTAKLKLNSAYEHALIFFIAYTVMIVLWSYSIIIPSL